ncbi:MAG TPA: caspase family protein [Planctomycetota bacterium]
MSATALLLAAAELATPATAQDRPGSRPRLALLVGVQNYELPADNHRMVPAPLSGVHNDMRSVQTVLRRHCGFETKDIEVLLDKDATHQRIVERFRTHLIAQADATTSAVFWFCGHGSRVADKSGRESNKGMQADQGIAGSFDGSLVCFDSRSAETYNRDLVDDEIYSLVRALAAKAGHVVVITDSCYSGDVTRGQRPSTARFEPADTRPWDDSWVRSIWPQDLPLLDDNDPLRTADEAGGLRWLHIAASSNSEVAFEKELPSGRRTGALTHTLTTLLRGPRARSWRELAVRCRALVAAEFPQTVSFEGDLDRPVFDGTFVQMPPGFVAEVVPDGRVLVEAGRLHGLGSECEVEIVDLDDKVIGIAKSDAVGAASSLFRLPGDAAKDLAARALVARLRGPASGRPPLRLKHLAGVPGDLLHGSEHAVFASDGADGTICRANDGTLQLLDPAGYVARTLPNDLTQLHDRLRIEHCYRTLRELVATPSLLEITLKPVSTSPEALGALAGREPAAAWTSLPDGRVEAKAPPMSGSSGGGAITFRIENRSARDVHVVLLSIVEDRSVAVVWPPSGQRDRTLRSGASVDALVLVGPSPRWTQPRAMIDRYVAVATTTWANFRPFESEASLAEIESVTRGAGDGMPGVLQLALRGEPTRGDTRLDIEAPFGIAWLDLLLLPPSAR